MRVLDAFTAVAGEAGEFLELVQFPRILVPGSAITAGVWLFIWLMNRGDRREKDAFGEVKEQRDEAKAELEALKKDLEALRQAHQDLAHELARYVHEHGLLDEDA